MFPVSFSMYLIMPGVYCDVKTAISVFANKNVSSLLRFSREKGFVDQFNQLSRLNGFILCLDRSRLPLNLVIK